MERNMKIGLAMVAVALIVAGGVFISLRFFFPPPAIIVGDVNIQISNGNNRFNLTLTQLFTMTTVEGNSAYQNRFENWRGNGTYRGVRISEIIEFSGGMDIDDTVRITASDGYSQDFSYYNIYPNPSEHAIQGDFIFAYVFNGSLPPDWSDGPRAVFLPEDEGYSVEDSNQTTHPVWFSGSGGARWVRNIESIDVLFDSYPPMGQNQDVGISSQDEFCNPPGTSENIFFIFSYQIGVYSVTQNKIKLNW